jgi:hypothetical protein
MSRITRSILLMGWCAVAGCGGGSAATFPTPTPSHGGAVSPIPDNRGYVEVVAVPADTAKGKRPSTQLVAYFLKTDAQTAMDAGVSNVTATLNLPEGEKSVPMTPWVKSGTPQKAAFISPAGVYGDSERVDGKLKATLDGKPVEIAFGIR